MKKNISVLLTVLMMLGILYPIAGSAAVKYVNMPIVTIRGDANPIYSANMKNQLTPVEVTKEELTQIVDTMYPKFLKGVALNKWEDYINGLEEAVYNIYKDCRLDGNGEVYNGSGIHTSKIKENQKAMTTNYQNKDGSYDIDAYVFWYDWRLDPFVIAEQLNEYIKGVKTATGKKWVSIRARCLGGSFLLAYLSMYGYSDIYNIAFDSTVANGSEKFSDYVCGNIVYDGEAFEREQTDEIYYGSEADTYTFSALDTLLNELVVALIDRCNENGWGSFTEKKFSEIFAEIKDELMPKVIMASYGTFPGYWSCVLKDDYQTARNFVFGSQEMQEKYKGLIEKLDRYDREVRQRIPEILNEAKEHDSYIGVVVKYGYQLTPFLESRNKLSDGLVCTQTSSFGATCALIGDTLSADYIADKKSQGLERYISADNLIDASTCLFPDSTWFIKGLHHDNWPACVNDLLVKICTRYGRLTIDDEKAYPQFMVYNKDTEYLEKMVSENCGVENYDAEAISKHSIKERFQSLKTLWQKLFELFKMLFLKKIKH